MRLGFDLHDGPIQDVLALAADVRLLQQQVYPFVLEDQREVAYGRFEDLTARLVDLDRHLREIAHSLETKSVLSRPLGEILHREVDNFAERTGLRAALEIRGDPDSLSSAQRITVFRAIQEALANVREHSGASSVDVRVRARRSAIEVQIADDGMGFEVERALAKAAQRGRLGLVGIAERVRMLGGTFEVESPPGGPTSLKFTLPRWEPLGLVGACCLEAGASTRRGDGEVSWHRIHFEGESAVPVHDDEPRIADRFDQTAIAGGQAGVVARIDELDAHAHPDSGAEPGRQLPCALGVHCSISAFGRRFLTLVRRGSAGVPQGPANSPPAGGPFRHRRQKEGPAGPPRRTTLVRN